MPSTFVRHRTSEPESLGTNLPCCVITYLGRVSNRESPSSSGSCKELHFRCEAIRADALLDSRYKPTGKALISTEIKHLDKPEKLPCLAKNCEGMIVAFLPLCKECFLQCKSGKTPVLELRDGLGKATYNATTEKVEFPPGVPKSRLPGSRRSKGVRKGLVFQVAVGTTALVSLGAAEGISQGESQGGETRMLVPYSSSFTFMESAVTASPDEASSQGATVRCLMAGGGLGVTFFVDSGAEQCLGSISSAFSDLQPCRVEVTEVSGSLPIFGWGTANFVATDHDGNFLVIVIPNCLYGQCEFNLLSVSQVHKFVGTTWILTWRPQRWYCFLLQGSIVPRCAFLLLSRTGCTLSGWNHWTKVIHDLRPFPSM